MRNPYIRLIGRCAVLLLTLLGTGIYSSGALAAIATAPTSPAMPHLAAPAVGTLALITATMNNGFAAGGNQVYVIDTNGKNGKILKDYGSATNPQFNQIAWSPDGNYLAYFAGQPPMLTIASADGSKLIPVTSSNNVFAWSPDGAYITVPKFSTGTSILSFINVDPTSPATRVQLFYHSSDLKDVDFLRWSPDGHVLLYMGTPASGPDDAEEVHLVYSNGNNDQIIIPADTLAQTAMWSSDSGKIAVIGAGGKIGLGLFVLDLRTNKMTKLIPKAVAADWSPDGTQFAFVTATGHLYTVNASGTGLIAINRPASLKGGITAIAWRPAVTQTALLAPPPTLAPTSVLPGNPLKPTVVLTKIFVAGQKAFSISYPADFFASPPDYMPGPDGVAETSVSFSSDNAEIDMRYVPKASLKYFGGDVLKFIGFDSTQQTKITVNGQPLIKLINNDPNQAEIGYDAVLPNGDTVVLTTAKDKFNNLLQADAELQAMILSVQSPAP